MSLPTFVAFTSRSPCLLIVAPIISSPVFLFCGIDSPVAIDSSIALSPFIIKPSVGIFSPGRTIIISPTFTSSIGTSISFSPRLTRAVLAPSCRSFLIAEEVFPLAFASRYLPVR